jgi:PQQ-dependent catabolism-associated beta-propeller protein
VLKSLAGFCIVTLSVSAMAGGSGRAIVPNERSDTLSILSPEHRLLKTVETCARPRGVHFNADRSAFFVACADDDLIAVYDTGSYQLVGRIRGVLIVSNEEDATASVYDVTSGELLAEYETGEEPEGVQVTADGRLVFVASEAANLVHVIDLEADAVIADILVDTRPRRFALTPDGRELWVSAELAGIVNIIEVATLKLVGDIPFLPTGFRPEQVTPVDLIITADGRRAYVALGRANHVAVVDVPARKVIDYLLVGKRAWGLALSADEKTLYVANGLSDDVTIIDTEKLKPIRSVATGRVPYDILIDDR